MYRRVACLNREMHALERVVARWHAIHDVISCPDGVSVAACNYNLLRRRTEGNAVLEFKHAKRAKSEWG